MAKQLQRRGDNSLSRRALAGIVTGCDRNMEWLLPWWWDNYSRQNGLPVAFADFGMSDKALAWCKERGRVLALPEEAQISTSSEKSEWLSHYGASMIRSRSIWYKKPLALLVSPFPYSLWIDLDCQVCAPLSPLFSLLYLGAEIALVKDRDGNRFLHTEEVHYNSGVIAFRKQSCILRQWADTARLFESELPGDEEALSRAIHRHRPSLVELPQLYNWFDDYGPCQEALIIHYAGPQGKLKILNQIMSSG